MNKRAISNPRASFLTFCLATAVICLLSGCGTLQEIKRQPFVAQTNAVATVIEIPATTNQVITPDGTGTVEVITPAKTITNWSTNITVDVNPRITSTINTAKGLNSSLNPTPSAPFINLGLTALSGILGIVATWKGRKANKEMERANNAEASADHHNELLETVIAGVETANDPKTKETIAQFSQLWKTKSALDAKVQEVTKS